MGGRVIEVYCIFKMNDPILQVVKLIRDFTHFLIIGKFDPLLMKNKAVISSL